MFAISLPQRSSRAVSRLVMAVAAVVTFHTGSSGPVRAQSEQAPARPPMVVVTTIKPVHALVSAVIGDYGRAELLIDGAASPHTYALKPSQVRRLNEARAVIMVSDDLETFMVKVASALPRKVRVVKLDQTPGVTRLPVREGGLFEKDEHDHGHDHGRGHGGHAHGGAKSGGTAMDAHLWLDPENGKAFVLHLAAVMSELDPDHKAAFESNARAYAGRLDQLRQTLADELRPVAGKPFLVFHDAYQYFESHYGLAAIGSIVVSPEQPPGARRLVEIRDKIVALGAACVFAEPGFEPALVEGVIAGTGARGGTLDPEGAALEPGAAMYGALLRGLADDLVACLAPGG